MFKRKIQFISLDLPYSEDLNINKLISTTLSSIAEFETNRRKERQLQGISEAKKAGKYRGRKTVIDDKLIAEVKHLKQQKMLSVTQIVKITGRSRNTIYKVLKEHLGYVSNRLIQHQETNEIDKLNFKSENLTVDWIGFNIQGLVGIKQVKQIAEYLLLNFGFNSTFAIGPNGKQETLFFNSKNKYQVYFRVYRYSDIY